jgi:ketosteroid isomerase-like protein
MGDGPRCQRMARLDLARRCRVILAVVCLLGGLASPARAQPADQPERAIRAALAKWTSDFNAREAAHICDLFAPDLVYDYRGFPERDYATLCGLLHRSLADPAKTFTYALDIREIIVSGDMAIARVVWTLKVASAGGKTAESREPGLDVFRRQPDGSWKIARYIAYEAP